ncbi:ABC transporter substrate-binding protein, partial [Clostridium perfringens]
MRWIKLARMMLISTMTLSVMAACSNQATESEGTPDKTSTEDTKTNTAPPDPLGKYPETVTVTQVLGYNPPEDPRTPQGITPEQNAYFKDLKDMLNIEVQYKWTVPSSQFEQKFSLAMASADLPDIMELDQKNFE